MFFIKKRIRMIKRRIINHKEKGLQSFLFLDIDGVLCPTSYQDMCSYSESAIDLVNILAEKYGLMIVFISSRRLYPGIWRRTERSLLQAGLKEKYIACDPDPDWLSEDHSQAVLNYLNKHVCRRFVIIDDTDYYLGVSSLKLFHVKPEGLHGFSKDDYHQTTILLDNFDNTLAAWK